MSDKLRLIGGVRYSHENKAFTFTDYADGVPGTYNFTTPYSVTTGSPSFNSLTYRVGAEFTPSRHTMVYGTISTGFESTADSPAPNGPCTSCAARARGRGCRAEAPGPPPRSPRIRVSSPRRAPPDRRHRWDSGRSAGTGRSRPAMRRS
ncbi:TonB-dependent receptor domain-containing protein [Sphingomonas bacterium]|uniref:TonB-dependent receptor domain-containing protein n=1 Tax=Sphingomonas bacterium TaxID=1895847 RepID=UPI0034A043E8